MASLLETFGILFDSDADEVKKGAQEAEQATDSLEEKIQDTDEVTAQLGETFSDLISSASGALAGILGAGAITAGIVSAAAATDEVGKFTETLGLNIEEVQAWSEAVVRSGGDAGAFQGSIQGLTQSLTDFAITGGGEAAEVLARLGINATDSGGRVRSAFELLPDIADEFQKLNEAESFGLGQKLGLDQGTILLLQQGSASVADLVERQRELGVATQEDYLAAAQFNDAVADTQQLFNSLFVTMGTTILPGFTDFLGLIQEGIIFLRDNSDLVIGLFAGIATGITTFYLPAIGAAITSTLAALAPFLAIGAAVAAVGAAFALVYDDIQNFIAGNDSIIGRIAEDYPAIGELVKTLAAVFGGLLDILLALGGVLGDVFVAGAKAALTVLDTLAQAFLTLINDMLGGFDGLGDGMVESIEGAVASIIEIIKEMGGIVTGFFDSIGDAAEGVSDFLGLGPDDASIEQVNQNIVSAGEILSAVESNPLNGQTSASIVNSSQQISREYNLRFGDTNINTAATDAEGIAQGAASAMNDQFRAAIETYDDGVAI